MVLDGFKCFGQLVVVILNLIAASLLLELCAWFCGSSQRILTKDLEELR